MAATAVKRPPKVDVDLMFLLSQASHALETELTARLQALGISPRAHCVLTHALRGASSRRARWPSSARWTRRRWS